MERQPERSLTYYLAAEDDPYNWVPLYFITSDANGSLYFGFESIELADSDIKQRLGAGELVGLGGRWPITPGQQLWKTPYGDVWLTAGSDPIEDPNRILVTKGVGPQFLSKHEIILGRPAADRHLVYIPDEYVDSPVYKHFARTVADELAAQLHVQVLPQTGIVARWDMLDSRKGPRKQRTFVTRATTSSRWRSWLSESTGCRSHRPRRRSSAITRNASPRM